ncbi:MAG: hypothetical protein M3305_05210, partial [Actinomycetota bacterium]|nr:hypothetical protein [Actinomycetota bacterium]
MLELPLTELLVVELDEVWGDGGGPWLVVRVAWVPGATRVPAWGFVLSTSFWGRLLGSMVTLRFTVNPAACR